MTIPVMMFVDGPAEGLMLSTAKQTYTVGLYPINQTEEKKGFWMCALYYKFGSDPAYGGARTPAAHRYPQQGVYKFKHNLERKASLIDGYLQDME